jgi:hypothetical protein
MRILRPIVFPATEIMLFRQAKVTQRSTVGWQFVGDEGIRDEALVFEQLSHQFQCCSLVSPTLNQDIQYLAFTIYCTPEVQPAAVDGDEHFVEMPPPVRPRPSSSQLARNDPAKLQRPAPDGLIRNVYAALGEHIFNIAIAEGKSEIQPDGMLDD